MPVCAGGSLLDAGDGSTVLSAIVKTADAAHFDRSRVQAPPGASRSARGRSALSGVARAGGRRDHAGAVGNDPSLADVIKMVHPKPKSASREALYGYLIGKPHEFAALPDVVKAFEAFKRDPSLPVPEVPFQMLTSMPLTSEHWVQIAETAGWQMLWQNLNTFARNGVFEVDGFAEKLATRLRDPEEIRRARVFPYQLMVAFAMTDTNVPGSSGRTAGCMRSRQHVPPINGNVVVCPFRAPWPRRRLGTTRDVGRPLHRCGCPGSRRDAAPQPHGPGPAVRERCGGYPPQRARHSDDQRREACRHRWWRNQLFGSAGTAGAGKGEGRPDGVRFGQPVLRGCVRACASGPSSPGRWHPSESDSSCSIVGSTSGTATAWWPGSA